MGENCYVKISEFGMSRNLYTSHYCIKDEKAAVPVRWMAKECFANKYSTRSDVWSFGVTMWEVFTLGKCIPTNWLKMPPKSKESTYTIILSVHNHDGLLGSCT